MAVKLTIEERGLITPYVEEFEAYARRHRVSVVEAMHTIAAEQPELVAQHERFSHAVMDDFNERWLDGGDEIRALRRARAQAEHAAAEKFRAEAAAARPAAGSFESFIADVLRREFEGDESRYSEALHRAGELRPDLRDAYVMRTRRDVDIAPAVERFRSAAPASDEWERLIESILSREFGGDRGRYSDAMARAGAERPDLMNKYLARTTYRGDVPQGEREGAKLASSSGADEMSESFADMESTLDSAIAGARDALASARVALKQSRESRNRESLEGGGLVYAVQERAWREHFTAEVTPAQSPDDEPDLIKAARLLLKSKFGNNPARWGEALGMAAKLRPDLARAFCGVVA